MQNLLLYATTVLIWGTTWIAIKFQLGDVSALLSIFYRYAIAAAALFLFMLATGRLKKFNFTRKQYFFLGLQAFFLYFLGYWLFYHTSIYLTSGLVAVCLSTITIMNIFNQALFFKIKVERQVLFATLLGLLGIVGVFWHEVQALNLHDDTVKGILFGLAATYAASIGNVLSSRNSRDGMPVLETNMLAMALGASLSFVAAMFMGNPLIIGTTMPYIVSLLYLSIFGSAIAFCAYLTLMARIGADRAAYAAVLFPIVALTISTFFENYHWTWEAIAGLGLVLIGNVLALTKPAQLRQWSSLVLKKNPA